MSKYDSKYYLRQTQRGWLRKQSLIEMKGGGCEKCGYNRCARCLSFHHRDPKSKKFNLDLRQIGNKSWEVILKEFQKCDLLCMNCHGEHHDGETNKAYLKYEMVLRERLMTLCLNCGKEFSIVASAKKRGEGKYCSLACASFSRRIVDRPSKEELGKLLWEIPTTHIAKKYGVCDKAITKWAKKMDLPKPPRGYWAKMKFEGSWCS